MKVRKSSKNKTSLLFNRYVWLIDIISRYGRITFEEINGRWQNSTLNDGGEELPLRTFHYHRTAIGDMFGVDISCDRSNGNMYYIENSDSLKSDGIRNYMLSAYTVNNLINESRQLQRRILFEKIPSGQQFLTPVIEAMRDNRSIEMSYQPFWNDCPIQILFDPYCLKIFKQRWYVIGRSDYHNAIRTYALDRIQKMQITETSFRMPKDFNPESRYENSFGIVKDDGVEPCTVKIKVFGQHRKYLQTLPLHDSQQEIEVNGDYSVFSYYIAPTADFKTELLSHGSEIEALAPEWLRSDMAATIRKMNQLYE